MGLLEQGLEPLGRGPQGRGLGPRNCSWSKHIVGLPSVVRYGDRLALFYDGNAEAKMPRGVKSHMDRDIGLAWLRLPLTPPVPDR